MIAVELIVAGGAAQGILYPNPVTQCDGMDPCPTLGSRYQCLTRFGGLQSAGNMWIGRWQRARRANVRAQCCIG